MSQDRSANSGNPTGRFNDYHSLKELSPFFVIIDAQEAKEPWLLWSHGTDKPGVVTTTACLGLILGSLTTVQK